MGTDEPHEWAHVVLNERANRVANSNQSVSDNMVTWTPVSPQNSSLVDRWVRNPVPSLKLVRPQMSFGLGFIIKVIHKVAPSLRPERVFGEFGGPNHELGGPSLQNQFNWAHTNVEWAPRVPNGSPPCAMFKVRFSNNYNLKKLCIGEGIA